ncbi:hypothetical protein U9M48_008874 [Paspalum notatum var. saurae]|uniref:Uncharacterized protein n=1 Tax=Paspalum notatum var. saurae TaxID=547442 RepID=A0AAQ3SRG7_PASNO
MSVWAGLGPSSLSWRVVAQLTKPWVAWVAVLSQSRQSLPRTPSRLALGLEHHGTELPWPTDAEHCLRSIGGLLPQSIEVFIIYLQSIGGPPVHRRA